MDRSAWLENRRKSLGASEVAAVCGLDPFKSALDVWAVKKGILPDDQSEAAELGNELEPVILQRYANKRGVSLRKPGTLQGAEPWITATPDAISSDGRNVQAKAVGRYMAHHWDDGPPDYVKVQCQWEMMVDGLPVTDIPTLICSTEFQIFSLEADSSIQAYILEICGAFWRDYVVADVMPELDGSETARAILLALNPERAGMLPATLDMLAMVEEHQRLDAQIKVLDQARERLRNLMRQTIGRATGMEWSGGRVTWKTNKAGERPLRIYTRTP